MHGRLRFGTLHYTFSSRVFDCQEVRAHKVMLRLIPQDDQCEFGLVCFQRGPNESVPGCIGQDPKGKFLLSRQRFLHSVFPFILLTLPLHFTNLRHRLLHQAKLGCGRCLESPSFAVRSLSDFTASTLPSYPGSLNI
jgi:hypothetical protein